MTVLPITLADSLLDGGSPEVPGSEEEKMSSGEYGNLFSTGKGAIGAFVFLDNFLKNYYVFCVCVCVVCGWEYMCPQRVILRRLTGILGPDLRSSARAVYTLNC